MMAYISKTTFHSTSALSKPQNLMREADQLLIVKVLFLEENLLYMKRYKG